MERSYRRVETSWISVMVNFSEKIITPYSESWTRPGKSAALESVRSRRSEVMLSVMVYSYVTGLYSTHQILSKLLDDPGTRTLCIELEIDAYSFRRFRRINAELVQDCLVEVFREFFSTRDGGFVSWDGEQRAVQHQMLHEEASTRLQRAAELDRKELEILLFACSTDMRNP
jgi:hypothetical protein